MDHIREYEKPEVITYSEEDIFEIIGPAQTITSDAGV